MYLGDLMRKVEGVLRVILEAEVGDLDPVELEVSLHLVVKVVVE